MPFVEPLQSEQLGNIRLKRPADVSLDKVICRMCSEDLNLTKQRALSSELHEIRLNGERYCSRELFDKRRFL